jgi:hypothetical protein
MLLNRLSYLARRSTSVLHHHYHPHYQHTQRCFSRGVDRINEINNKISTQDRTDDDYDTDAANADLLVLHDLVLNDTQVNTRCSDLTKIMSCLRNSSGQSEVALNLLTETVFKLSVNTEVCTSDDIENAFIGLQNLEISDNGVKLALVELQKRLILASDINNTAISSAYLGLQRLHSTEFIVRAILRELNKRLRASKEPLVCDDFSRIFHGLSCMSNRDDEVRDLLGILLKKVIECREPSLYAAEEGAMFGFYHMNKKDKTYASLVLELKKKECDFEIIGMFE